MNRSLVLLSSLAVLTLTGVFIARQGTLRELRDGNETLRWQMEVQSHSVASPSAAEDSSAFSVAPLSPDEKSELLRLRGQFPSLCSQVTEVSNRVVSLSRSRNGNPSPAKPISPESQRIRLVMEEFMRSEPFRNAEVLSKGVQAYMREHGGQLPEDLASVPWPGDRTVAEETIRRFELVRTGTIADDPSMLPYLLVAREREPLPLPDGRCAYLFIQANGGLTIATRAPDSSAPGPEFIRATEEEGRRRVRQEQMDARQ